MSIEITPKLTTCPLTIENAFRYKKPESEKYIPEASEVVFVFIRHGENLSNIQRTYDGRTLNLPLTDKGKVQGQNAGKALSARIDRIDHVITNAMCRTKETAEQALTAFSSSAPTHSETSGFMERWVGHFEGELLSEFESTQKKDKETSANPDLSFEAKMEFSPIPGEVEAYGEIWRRVCITVEKTAAELKGRVVLAVTHSGTMRSIYWHLTKELGIFVPYDNFKPNNGAFMIVSVKEGKMTLMETHDIEIVPST
jgi:broad specificity phosphatase PhoE